MKNRLIIFVLALVIFSSVGSFANHYNRPRSTFSVRKAISERAALRAIHSKINTDALLNDQKNDDSEKTQGTINRSISIVQRVLMFIQSSTQK
jgi:hypothetical protein